MLAIQSFKHCPEKYKQQNKGNMKLGEKLFFYFCFLFLSHLLCLALNERIIQMSFYTILIHIKWRIRINRYDDLHFYLGDMMSVILWTWYLLLILIQIMIILRTDHLLVRHEIHRETSWCASSFPKKHVYESLLTPLADADFIKIYFRLLAEHTDDGARLLPTFPLKISIKFTRCLPP